MPDRMERRLLDRAIAESDDALQACAEHGLLLIERDHVRYRHELSRRVVEESLGAPRRRELNARVLALLGRRAARRERPCRGWCTTPTRRVTRRACFATRRSPPRRRRSAARTARRQRSTARRSGTAITSRRRARAALLDKLAREAFSCGLKDEALDANERAFALWREARRHVRAGPQSAHALRVRRVRELRRIAPRSRTRSNRRSGCSSRTARRPISPWPTSTGRCVLSMRGQHDEAHAFEDKALAMAEALADPHALAHVLLLVERRRNSFLGVPRLDRVRARARSRAAVRRRGARRARVGALCGVRALGRAICAHSTMRSPRACASSRSATSTGSGWSCARSRPGASCCAATGTRCPDIAADVLAKPSLPGLADYFANVERRARPAADAASRTASRSSSGPCALTESRLGRARYVRQLRAAHSRRLTGWQANAAPRSTTRGRHSVRARHGGKRAPLRRRADLVAWARG